MEPDDRTVDRDADPTRVRPDRQLAHRTLEDADASPTTVRPRVTDTGGGEFRASGIDTQASDTQDSDTQDSDTRNSDTQDSDTGDSDSRGSESEDLDRWFGPVFPSGRRRLEEARFADEVDAAPTTDQPAGHSGPSAHRQDGWVPVQRWRGEPAETSHDDADATPSPLGPDPDGAPTTVLTVAHDSDRRRRRRDWAWVEEWRAERSAPAWGPGIAIGIFVALIVAVALIVLTSGVSDSPVLAVVFNVVIAAGMAPALWLCRSLPVLRFLAAGAAAGIVLGWIAMLTTF